MPPKGGTKRAGQASKGMSPAKVKKVEEPKVKKEEVPKDSDPLMESVADAIRQADLTDGNKEILLKMGPCALDLPVEERHRFHTKVIKMIGDSIQDTHSEMTREAEEAGSAVEAAKAKKTALEATTVEADSKFKVADKTVRSKDIQLQDATTLASNKQTLFDKAKDAQTKCNAESEALKQEKRALSEVDFEGEESAQHYKVIEPLIANLNLDESLRLALPSTCQKKPCDRGPFDTIVMVQLDKELQMRIEALLKLIDACVSAAPEHAAAVQAAEKDLRAAKETKETAQQDLQDAKAKRMEAYDFLTSSRKAVAEGLEELIRLSKIHDKKLKARALFENWNMSSFARLRDKSAA